MIIRYLKNFFINNKVPFLLAAICLRLMYLFHVRTLSNVSMRYIFVEMIVLTVTCNLISNRIVRFLFIFPLIFISGCDLVNIVVTGSHIVPLTIMNLNVAGVIGAETLYKVIIYFIFYTILWIPDLLYPSIKFLKSTFNRFAFLFMIVACFLIYSATLNSTAKTLYSVYSILSSRKLNPQTDKELFNQVKARYRKTKVVERESELKLFNKSLAGYNVVVLFTEGMSFDIISKEVTPNAYKLMNKSIVIDNYYNHTAATFRGLRGQLISGYQNIGGFYNNPVGAGQLDLKKEKLSDHYAKLESLPSILSDNGYYTLFINPQADDCNLSHFLRFVGFDKVIGNTQKGLLAWSDKELYDRIWDNIEPLLDQEKPLFAASYIFGTHEGMDSPHVKFGDGKNPYLNKFHNQDHWLGSFLEKFDKSEKTDKTILIFTTDHSTNPSKVFRETFKIKSPYFVDRIPFFIYVKGFTPQLPDNKRHLNKYKRNSLAFAPTVLDILNIHNAENHFLGTSLFDVTKGVRNINDCERFSVIGNDIYYISDSGRIIRLSVDNKELQFLRVRDYESFAG